LKLDSEFDLYEFLLSFSFKNLRLNIEIVLIVTVLSNFVFPRSILTEKIYQSVLRSF